MGMRLVGWRREEKRYYNFISNPKDKGGGRRGRTVGEWGE